MIPSATTPSTLVRTLECLHGKTFPHSSLAKGYTTPPSFIFSHPTYACVLRTSGGGGGESHPGLPAVGRGASSSLSSSITDWVSSMLGVGSRPDTDRRLRIV